MRPGLRPEPALSLAALRIVVAALVLVAPGFREGVQVAAQDPRRWVAPEGLGWFVSTVPINPKLAVLSQLVCAFAGFAAIAGVYTRPALGALTVSSFYLYSIAQLSGFVWHDAHLLWFSALLALSPCDDVLAVDARRPLLSEHARYAPALWAVRLLLGVIYFFPGYHKLATSGIKWAFGENLKYQLYWKWVEHGITPSFRWDQIPGLLTAGGLFVIAFELSFVGWVLWKKARPFLALAGIGFHLLSQFIFLIPFASLWLCYVALIDLRPVAQTLRRPCRRMALVAARFGWRQSADLDALEAKTSAKGFTAVAGFLLLAAAVQGFRGQMQSYPFPCYPTFQWIAPKLMPDLEIVAYDAHGNASLLVHARDARGYRTQRQWAELWSLAGATGSVNPSRLRAYYETLAAQQPPDTKRVVFYRTYFSVLPEDRGNPPLKRVRLWEI